MDVENKLLASYLPLTDMLNIQKLLSFLKYPLGEVQIDKLPLFDTKSTPRLGALCCSSASGCGPLSSLLGSAHKSLICIDCINTCYVSNNFQGKPAIPQHSAAGSGWYGYRGVLSGTGGKQFAF